MRQEVSSQQKKFEPLFTVLKVIFVIIGTIIACIALPLIDLYLSQRMKIKKRRGSWTDDDEKKYQRREKQKWKHG